MGNDIDQNIYYCTHGLDTQATKEMAETALQLWADVLNINLISVSPGDAIDLESQGIFVIRFEDLATDDIPVTPAGTTHINVPTSWSNQFGTELGDHNGDGQYLLTTFVHEIGHALGLGHPGPYNDGEGEALFSIDTWQASIMSGSSLSDASGNSDDFAPPVTPQMADIFALQSKFGANPFTRTYDTWYGFNSNAGPVYDFATYITPDMTADGGPVLPVALTIYDSGGIDTLDCSGFAQDQTIRLEAGEYSDIGGKHGNVGIYGVGGAADTIIENATGGSGNDDIHGNQADNTLHGGAGSDFLYGYEGEDHLYGEGGEDLLNGGDEHDVLWGGDDNDHLRRR